MSIIDAEQKKYFVKQLNFIIMETKRELTNDEKMENSILDILKRNEVTPVILGDVIEDLVKC